MQERLILIYIGLILSLQSDAAIQRTLKKGAPEACEEATRPRQIQDTTASLTSPNFPLPYDGLDHCEWHFKSTDTDVSMIIMYSLNHITECHYIRSLAMNPSNKAHLSNFDSIRCHS